MSKTANHKRLGNYIRVVDVRNRELQVETLLGLSIEKRFIPSIANTIGTDMSSYKVVQSRQFAYGPVTSRNGDKITIALYEGEGDVIISQAYTVFEITDVTQLYPDYLMMWFRRPEFDRYARFRSHGSAREIFDWETMCDVMLPVPSIEEQHHIVSEYQALTKRIEINNQLIAKLEDTAQALYRKMFVDGIDKENLPEGWRMGTLGEYCLEMKSGGTPSRSNHNFWNSHDYRWLKTGEVHNNIIFDTEEYISEDGLKGSSAKLIPSNSVIMAMYGATAAQVAFLNCETTTNQACCNMICRNKLDASFLYFHLLYNQNNIKRLANGGAQENLSQELIAKQIIIIFDDDNIKNKFVNLIDLIICKSQENILLTDLQSLLLSKMGTN